MTPQELAWAADFGDAYTARNRVNWRARIPFWREMIEATGARSVFEAGCNAGWNLSAIKRACPDVSVYGCDINEQAVGQATLAGLEVTIGTMKSELDGYESVFDLVFTCGVLIHFAPENLQDAMRQIIDASADYVLAVEYASESGDEEPVTYRGQENMLWRRDYGRLYRECELQLVDEGEAKGFDRCHFWLMRHKP